MRRGLGFFSLKNGRFRRDLNGAYNCVIGRCKEDGARFLSVVHSGRMVCKGQKLKHRELC